MNEIKLIYVDAGGVYGNNKYYNMRDNGDGTFTATYGRVGKTSTNRNYPISKWQSTYRSKLKKGYKDITPKETVVFDNLEGIDDSVVRLVKRLLDYANHRVQSVYVASGSVTLAQIKQAQSLLDSIALGISQLFDMQQLNSMLLEVYRLIPRKMDNVNNHLITNNQQGLKLLETEQDNLDALATTVQTDNTQTNVLETLGIEIETVPDKALIDRHYRQAYKITNKATNASFNNFQADNNLTTQQLYHASRPVNILSILQKGLLIRPTGVATNGSNFGDGIYFADEPAKSLRYSGGNEFLLIYEVATGNQYNAPHTNSRLGLAYLAQNGYHSTVGVADGRYNEHIIYRPDQCNINYLIEF